MSDLGLIYFKDIDTLRSTIRACQALKHVQQVAYSTYHDCLTQICFDCERVRTSLKKESNNGSS